MDKKVTKIDALVGSSFRGGAVCMTHATPPAASALRPSVTVSPARQIPLSYGYNGDWRSESYDSVVDVSEVESVLLFSFELSQVTSCKHDLHLQCILEW